MINNKKRKRNKPGRITAWLITWEWIGDHAARKDKIAAVLRRTTSPETVMEIANALYANEYYTLAECVSFTRNKALNPYPAHYDDIKGVPYRGRIVCGHNPYLEARLVDNLYFGKDTNGNEILMWDEQEKPILITSAIKNMKLSGLSFPDLIGESSLPVFPKDSGLSGQAGQ